jgi:hypothetical protein
LRSIDFWNMLRIFFLACKSQYVKISSSHCLSQAEKLFEFPKINAIEKSKIRTSLALAVLKCRTRADAGAPSLCSGSRFRSNLPSERLRLSTAHRARVERRQLFLFYFYFAQH